MQNLLKLNLKQNSRDHELPPIPPDSWSQAPGNRHVWKNRKNGEGAGPQANPPVKVQQKHRGKHYGNPSQCHHRSGAMKMTMATVKPKSSSTMEYTDSALLQTPLKPRSAAAMVIYRHKLDLRVMPRL